ncbi:MAG: hypothetical protein R3C19_25190 [Planctomycetaceae bacterium]
MKAFSKHPLVLVMVGALVGGAAVWSLPQDQLRASTAGGNDKFSMVTVPVTGVADTEAVFVLDHLTGILRGGHINGGGNGFTCLYQHNVAADFQVNPNTPQPKYVIISGAAQLRSQGGGGQPANGILYVAEQTSGMVVAYGFSQPNNNSGPTGDIVRIGVFPFREALVR